MEPTNMQYVRLGKSGLKVSKLILGCASYGALGTQAWGVSDEDEAVSHIETAYKLGINTFDVADAYRNGGSEVLLGKAIKKLNLPRDEIVVMTKAWAPLARGSESIWGKSDEWLGQNHYTNQYGLSRKHLFDAIKASLKRLQLDYVDLYQCHRFDYDTPVEETMQALHDIVKAGYARYIGMSSCFAWQFFKMQSYAREHGLTEFISMQNLFNPIYREEEREMIPMLVDRGVGMVCWSPLAMGRLAKPMGTETERSKADPVGNRMTDVPFMAAVNQRVEEIAKQRKVSMAQVTLAWVLSKDFVTAPIIGATSLEKMRDAVGALEVKLTAEEINSIDNLYEPRGLHGFK